MAKTFTIQEFFRHFPDDDACLEHLMQRRFGERLACPKCGRHGKYHRIRKEPAYACQWCGHHIHPMVGTPFERSRTPLQKWFYAIYLFTTSRHGVPAKELQRQLGVTYKTAWRIGHVIRHYMGIVDGNDRLDGHVESDETLIGGRKKGAGKGQGRSNKTIVLGMVERGGDVLTGVIANVKEETVEPIIRHDVAGGSTITTDESTSYKDLRHSGYDHGAINHSASEYRRGKHHTNSIEGFWSMLKRSIRGAHVHVSAKWLPSYLGEFEYRFNRRRGPHLMFVRLLTAF